MQLSPLRFSAREKRLSLWLGAASLSFGIFVKITSELLEHEVRGLDSSILTAVAKMRRPWLTGTSVDVTALGSTTLVILISVAALCIFLSLNDRPGDAPRADSFSRRTKSIAFSVMRMSHTELSIGSPQN
jgi:hypothetical protein